MTDLKIELSKVVETSSLTVLLQTLADSGDQSYLPGASFPCVGITTLKGSPLVFTDSGVYADLPVMMQVLEDIASQHLQPAAK